MNYDDRTGKKPLDFNQIHENEQKIASGYTDTPKPIKIIPPPGGAKSYGDWRDNPNAKGYDAPGSRGK